MWIVRQISMLMVMVAMLLPSALFRDCCCSRRARLDQSSKQPLKACCKARLARAAKLRLSNNRSPGLVPPTCQCRSSLATATLPETKSGLSTDSSQNLADSFEQVASIDVPMSSPKGLMESARRHTATDPPLRVSLCRWAI